MNAHLRTPDAPPCWLVVTWLGEDCRYFPVAAFASREEAVAEAARHDGGTILFRPPPAAAPVDPTLGDEF